jgi:hypothetical protein
VVEAGIEVWEGRLQVEAAHGLQVLVARQAAGAADERSHEDEVGGQKLRPRDALPVVQVLLRLEQQLLLADGEAKLRDGLRLVEEHRVGGQSIGCDLRHI